MKTITRWIAAKFGYALIPIIVIETMELESRNDYVAMKRQNSERDKGYFNGLADYASKTAKTFRERYLPPNP